MKQFLIIPTGGKGQRFIDAGYKVYKPFLNIGHKTRIIDNIIKNFDRKNLEVIIIINSKYNKFCNFSLSKKKIHIINIKSHKLGPLYSIFLASNKIKKIVGKNNIFISYSDINWKWNYKRVKKHILGKKVVIFSHTGFHPHLEVDSKSDFCRKNKKNNIIKISQKKTFSKDYKKDLLAVGCYYFKSYEFIDNFFKKSFSIFKNKKKEFYMVLLIKFLIRNNINIKYKNIKNFVHLGSPNQYGDYISWRTTILKKFNKSLKFDNTNIMLMAGEGKRVKDLNTPKPFLDIGNFQIFKYILKKFGFKKNIIITNNKYLRKIKKNNFKIHLVSRTNSMLSTVEKSMEILRKNNNFFLTSCDCYGELNKSKFNKFLKKNRPELVIFGYNFSNLQKKLINSHTALKIKNNKLFEIIVKHNSRSNSIGHAGFFWIKNHRIFQFIENFKKLRKFNREIIVDDYFKYLFDKKKCKILFYKLDNYVHIGSVLEYKELKYWENYFKKNNE